MVGGQYPVRCGGWNALVSWGIDSGMYQWFDADGTLAGVSETGLGNGVCVAYEASFAPPSTNGCEDLVPFCPLDGGAPEDSGPILDVAVPDPRTCLQRDPLPPCEDGVTEECAPTWDELLAAAPECRTITPGSNSYLATCAGYDVHLQYGIDSGFLRWFDETGKLVGTSETGLGSGNCVAYDSSFDLPPDLGCIPLKPECLPDGGVPADAASN
jgi:hypothetical protein